VDKKIYQGDGYSTSFSFPYNVYLATDLAVYETVVATSNTTQLTLNTNYSITLTAISGVTGAYTATINLAGGSSPAGALAVGTQLTILRSLPLTQLINISDYSATPAATWNQAFDRQTILVQQMQEQLNRAILGPITSTNTSYFPGPSPGTIIGWDSSGNLANLVNPSLTAQWSLSAGNIYYNTGNVGIGTVSPTQTLTVSGGTILGTASGAVGFTNNSVNGFTDLVGGTPKDLRIQGGASGNTILNVNAGNVGIGTPTPATILDVNGAITVRGQATFTGGDVYTNAWADYSASSTIVGWTSISTKWINVSNLGKRVFVSFYITGTSNSTSTSFTLPYTCGSPNQYGNLISYLDNGAQTLGQVYPFMGSGGAILTFVILASSTPWTNSGTKTIQGNFSYQSS